MTQETQQNKDSYNGWSNRETWLVNLWLTNEEMLYGSTLGRLALPAPEGRATELEGFVDELIEMHAEGHQGQQFPGFIMDLLNASLARVDWQEIVSSLMEE